MAKFSSFDSEPRRPASTHVSTLPLKNYQYQTAPQGAPPPYRSYPSSQDDDDNWSSNVGWSSETSSANSQKPLGKRRASWSSLVQADENMHKYKENCFPKVGSPASNVSSTYSSAINSAIPQKTILSPQSLNGSLLYVNQLNSHKMVNNSPAGIKDASRQNSHTSSGVISDFFVQSKGSSYYKFNESGPPPSQQYPPLAPLPAGRMGSPRSAAGAQVPGSGSRASSSTRQKRDRMEDLRKFWRKPGTRLGCLALILLAIAAVILAYVLTQAMLLPKHLKFSWLAPELFRKGEPVPNMIQFDVAGDQARFDLAGNMPFKGNFINILDFKTNKIAIVDATLRTGQRNFACFVMDLDRGNIPNLESLQRAARGSTDKNKQQAGWQEAWNYVASPLNTATPREQLFQPEIAECRGARWIELTRVNTNQKSVKCTDCYEFCVPEYGIEHDYIRDEHFLNIIRRDCFNMFVPEWKSFAQSYSPPQQSQQDFESYFRLLQGQQQQQQNLQPQVGNQPSNIPSGGGAGGVGGSIGAFLGNVGGAVASNPTVQKLGEQAETKWISLQTVPQQISNFTSDAYQNLRANANQFSEQFRQQFMNAANQQQNPSNSPNPNNPNPYPQDMGGQFGAGGAFVPNNPNIPNMANYNPNTAMSGTFQNPNVASQNSPPLTVSSQFSSPVIGSPPQMGTGTAGGSMYNTRAIQNLNPNINPSSGFNPSVSNPNFPAGQSQTGSSAPTLSELLHQNRNQNDQQQQFGGQSQNPFAYNPNQQQQPPQQSFGVDLSMRSRGFPATQGVGGTFNPNAQNFGSNQQWNQNPNNFG